MHGSTYPKIVISPLGGGNNRESRHLGGGNNWGSRHLGGDKTFTIRSVNYAKERRVKSVTLNGKPHDSLFLRHAEIAAGGELVFEYE